MKQNDCPFGGQYDLPQTCCCVETVVGDTYKVTACPVRALS